MLQSIALLDIPSISPLYADCWEGTASFRGLVPRYFRAEGAFAEQARIIESARAEAAQILAQTRTEIEAQQRQAEAELRALLAELVVAGAARRLETQVRGDVAGQVLDRSIEQVGGRP